MKTKEQIQKETTQGYVFTSQDFWGCLLSWSFNEYDGNGYFHDGEAETALSVWDDEVNVDTFKEYPYVVWYNR